MLRTDPQMSSRSIRAMFARATAQATAWPEYVNPCEKIAPSVRGRDSPSNTSSETIVAPSGM